MSRQVNGSLAGYKGSHAVVIGINDYKHASPLRYASNDAREVSEVLQRKFGFPKANVVLLLDSEATRSSIHRTVCSLTLSGTDCDDRVLIFFAGHGHTERNRRGADVGYLVPHDGDPEDLSTLLRWDLLTREIELCDAKHAFFIMDACYGGLAITRSLKSGSSRYLKDMFRRFSRQVLSSGKANEMVSDAGGPRLGHSVFTGHLLDALEGDAMSNGILSANGVMAYVYEKVSRDQDSEQTPHYGYLAGDGDFIFTPNGLEDSNANDSTEQDTIVPVPGGLLIEDDQVQKSSIELAKSFLSSADRRIDLHELVVRETRQVLSKTSFDLFPLNSPWSDVDAPVRIERYNDAARDLLSIQMLIGNWGEEGHRNLVALAPKRIAERIRPTTSWNQGWLAIRQYLLRSILYSTGIGAVASGNYKNLRILFESMATDAVLDKSEYLFDFAYERHTDLDSVFKLLPGHERQYVPVSEYLLKHLQPIADDVLYLGAEYELVFDRFETLLALHVRARMGWIPFGRYGWKRWGRGGQSSPIELLVKDANSQGDEWDVLQAGFFGGSKEVFKKALETLDSDMKGLNWR